MAKVVQDFRYTGAAQTFTVPQFVTSVYFECWGAPGAQGEGAARSLNGIPGSTGAMAYNNGYSLDDVRSLNNLKTLVGYVAGTLDVTAGTSYGVYVGGSGGYGNRPLNNFVPPPPASTTNYGPGGWNGGGNGGYADLVNGALSPGDQLPGGGGGGATDIRSGGTALADRIMVAGGGGGAGGRFAVALITATGNPTIPDPPYSNDVQPNSGANDGPNYFPTSGSGYGGPGGGVTGGTGGGASRGPTDNIATSGGRGGNQTTGGAGGTSTGTFSNAGAAGVLGIGGHGGNVLASDYTGSSEAAYSGGGGGGGGYYGGGGGSSGTKTVAGYPSGGGGGGGSNFVSGSFTGPANFAHVPPAETGVNGFARATYTQIPNPPAITSPGDGSYVDVNSELDVAWLFSSLVTSESQGGFDVGYSVHGADSWTLLLHPTSPDLFLAIPANTFTGGTDYDLRVRTYDSAGDASAYTTILIHGIDVPHAPTITSPTNGENLSTNPFDVTWTVDSGITETLYRVQTLDATGNIVTDSGDLYSTRVNACTNPSFEVSTAGWTTGGGCSLAQSTTHSLLPTHSGKITWGTGASGTQGIEFEFPTIPGKVYTCSLWVTVDTPGVDPDILLEALDADAASQLGTPAVISPTAAGTFVRGSTTFTAQSTTSFIAAANNTDATAGQVAYIDAVLIEYGVNENAYFDGSNANGNPGTASWQGTAGLSASQLAVANVLTYSVDWPLPSQPISIKVMYADTTDLNIYSPAASVSPSVNLNPPDAPEVTIVIDNDAGIIRLNITNPPGTFTAIKNEVYRQNLTAGTPEELVETTDPSVNYIDYTPVTQTVYAYRVRAYSADGGFADAT